MTAKWMRVPLPATFRWPPPDGRSAWSNEVAASLVGQRVRLNDGTMATVAAAELDTAGGLLVTVS